MNTFIEKTIDWLLDKEEVAANNGRIDLESIDKQIDKVKYKKEKYLQDVEKHVHELDHILERLESIKNHQSSTVSDNNHGKKVVKKF